jgi:Flp pilus assembly protein TadB
MAFPLLGVFSALGDMWSKRQERKARIAEAKTKAEEKKYEAEGKRAMKEAESERTWDIEALKGSQKSWKDEFIMVLWFAPFIMLFIPNLQPYAVKGFTALATVPYGYWLVLFGIVAQAFGLRWLFQKRIEKAIKSVKDFESDK